MLVSDPDNQEDLVDRIREACLSWVLKGVLTKEIEAQSGDVILRTVLQYQEPVNSQKVDSDDEQVIIKSSSLAGPNSASGRKSSSVNQTMI